MKYYKAEKKKGLHDFKFEVMWNLNYTKVSQVEDIQQHYDSQASKEMKSSRAVHKNTSIKIAVVLAEWLYRAHL